jgi:lysophospholipase L1-like esterase
MTNHHKPSFIALGFALCTAALGACSSSNNSTPSAPPAAKPLYLNYTAIGASDAVGYGATVPCANPTPASGAPATADPTCSEPGASGYVPDIRTDLAHYGFAASLQDLGISGAVVGPDISALQEMAAPLCPAGTSTGNFVQNELPKVNPAATFITIFAGGNDVNAILKGLSCGLGGATTTTQTAYITKEVTAFGQDFGELVGGVHKAAPGAIIVVANIPNFANVPYAFYISSNAAVDLEAREALQGVSVAIDTDVINTVATDGIPVVDLQCNPASYTPSNFFTDGFHPDDAGYAALAAQFVQQALSSFPAAPQSSCIYQGLASAPGVTPTAAARSAIHVEVGSNLRLPVR